MVWTQFWDMRSGGSQKLDWPQIFIEAPESEARSVFYAKFGRNPDRVTCTCCGEDYALMEHESLEDATWYHRREQSLDDYIASGVPKVVRASDISDSERAVDVPREGYVWFGDDD